MFCYNILTRPNWLLWIKILALALLPLLYLIEGLPLVSRKPEGVVQEGEGLQWPKASIPLPVYPRGRHLDGDIRKMLNVACVQKGCHVVKVG